MKFFLALLFFLPYQLAFSQVKNSENFFFNETDSLDIGISSEIKLGSLFIFKKYKKFIKKEFKEPYGYKCLKLYNKKNICTVVLFPVPNNYFIKSFELVQNDKNKKITKDFKKYEYLFKTNQFKICLNDSIHSVIEKLSNTNVAYEKKTEGMITCLKIKRVLKAELNDIIFENGKYLAEYYFINSILNRIKISFPLD